MRYFSYDEMYKKALSAFEYTDAKNPIDYAVIKPALKKRKTDVHKGNCGRLLVCAGSTGLTGAAYLACMGALRCGCGLVTLCCAKELNDIFEIKLTEVMTMPVASRNGIILSDAFDEILSKLPSADALLCGPGLSRNDSIKELIVKLIKTCDKPMIIDADGLNAIAKDTSILKSAISPVILTPHIGEFSRMTGYDTEYILKNGADIALKFAKEHGVILVLKSHKTIVTDGTDVYQNVLGNPGMAVGGTGDVLSGCIAAFAAQGNPPLTSALAGVYIHSLAGDMAAMETGEISLIPSDIVNYISHAIRETLK